MAYLGNSPVLSQQEYRNIDNISGSFNGVTTSFALRVNGVAPVPAPQSSNQCLISVNGVVQKPDDTGATGFRLSGGNIIFSSAPTGGQSFFGVILAGADYIYAGQNFPDGTVTAPSITFNQDLGTGFYRSGAGEVRFTSSGTNAAILNSSSLTAPSFIPTSSTAPTNGVYLPAANTVAISTGGSGRLFINSSGKIGVNTSTPSSQFSVGSDTSAPSVISLDYNPTNTTAASISANHSTGEVRYGAVAAYFPTFYSNNVERLRITSAGLVGIGTSSPSGPLHVTASSNGYISSTFSNTSAGTSAVNRIQIGNDASDGSGQLVVYGSQHSTLSNVFDINNANNAALRFLTNNTERVRITGSGNVGIGVTSPAAPLDLSGDVIVRGANSTIRFKDSGNTTQYLAIYGNSTDANINAGVNNLVFYSAATERARFDGSGRLLVGTSTARSTGTLGTNYQALIEKAGDYAGFSVFGNKANNQGSYLVLGKSRGTTAGAVNAVVADDVLGYIGFEGTDGTNSIRAADIFVAVDGTPGTNDMPGRLVFSTTLDGTSSPVERLRIDNTGAATFTKSGYNPITIGGGTGESIFRNQSGMSGFHFSSSAVLPTNGTGTVIDNTISLGSASWRYAVIFAGTGTINTSDANLKQDIEDLEQAELNVATAIKGLIKKFRFIDAVAAKGNDARLHVGVIAQEVEQTFVAEGLDPRRYALFCEDTLEDGSKRLGIRYDELLAFVIAAL